MTELFTPAKTTTTAPERQAAFDLEAAMKTAIEHHRNEQYDDAAALYTRVLGAASAHLDANYHLGVLYMQTGRPADAVPHFEVALGQVPKNGQIWVYYVNALIGSEQREAARAALELARQQGLPQDAVETLRARIDGREEPAAQQTPEPPASVEQTVAAEPQAPAAADAAAAAPAKLDLRRASAKEIRHCTDLLNSDKLEAGLKAARRLTEQYPAHGECWIALTHALTRSGHYMESVTAAERAATLLPDNVHTQTTYADKLYITRQHDKGEKHCRKALERHPDCAGLHRTLGALLQAMGRHAEGIASMRRAVELAPDNALELDALANALQRNGLFSDAEAAFRRALELAPQQAATHSNLLFCLMHKIDLDAPSAFAEFTDFAARHEAPLRAKWRKHTNDRDRARRLRIGFVSGDLVNHPVAYFFLSVLEHLARDPGLHLHIYSNYVVSDDFTAQVRVHAHEWHEIFGLPDADVAQKIRDDGIDILIDLSGHTGRNRLVAFAHKPAPVQVSWIGNPATTGLTSIDYYMSDRFVTPLEQFADKFSEKLVFLPALAPFKPHPQAPDVNELPALKNGYMTFGSFSRIVKIGPEVVALWARVLREVPNSRMLIGAISAPEQMSRLTNLFVSEGVDVSRVSFLKRGDVVTYLQQHHLIDVCLDAFPFAGSTTTMQALWMGVPTMTLPGASMASRGSTGWLSHLGLEDAFVATDKDDFVRKCAALAADPEALATVRRELRQHCMESPLISASTIARAASRALRTMWERWCDGLEPEHFEVLADDVAQAPRSAETAVAQPSSTSGNVSTASTPVAPVAQSTASKQTSPFFSIIVPTHKRAPLLRRALQSVKSQHAPVPVEVIVISDVSDADTDAVCHEMLGSGDVYMRRNGPAGPSESRNVALDLAKGRYVVFLDDDDALHPHLLAQLYAHPYVQNGEPVYFNCSIVHERRFAERTEFVSETEQDLSQRLTEDVFMKNQLPFSCYAFPKALLDGIRFDTFMRAYEDWEFLLAVFEREMPKHVPLLGPRVHQVPEGPTDRRGSTAAATGFDAVLDYLYVYRRRPAPTLALKEKRAAFIRTASALNIPASVL